MPAFGVITIKRFDSAKQRLAESLEPERRRRLAEAMFADLLDAVVRVRLLDGLIAVTGEARARRMAAEAGVEVIDDPDEGHSAAAVRGIVRAVERDADRVVLLPGDCPLLDPRELDRLLTGMPSPWVVVVPDRHGTGTNSLAIAPPDAITPAFGEGSCARHRELARTAGVPHSIERVESLALDLDTPADVIALTSRLEADRAAGRPDRARHTAAVLGI